MPLTSLQTATLKAAIQADAALTTLVAGRDAYAIANYYAVATATQVTVPSLPKADFMLGTIAGVAAINGASTVLQNKWDRLLQVVLAMDPIRTSLPAVQSILAQLVTDGLMTRPQVDAFSKRPATRVENLLGAGITIDAVDVAEAMYNPNGTLK